MGRRSRDTPVRSTESAGGNAAPGATPDRALFQRAVEDLDRRKVGAVLSEKEADIAGAPVPAAPARRRGRRADTLDNLDAPPSIDLHRLDRATALERLAGFLAVQPRGSVVLVVHGKGEMVLANAVARFLELSRSVAEHRAAPPRWGGAGARVVRLR